VLHDEVYVSRNHKQMTYLQYLKDREEVLLQPVLEVPHYKMTIRNLRVKQRLITKVPVRVAV
jgi:hypothetical protein